MPTSRLCIPISQRNAYVPQLNGYRKPNIVETPSAFLAVGHNALERHCVQPICQFCHRDRQQRFLSPTHEMNSRTPYEIQPGSSFRCILLQMESASSRRALIPLAFSMHQFAKDNHGENYSSIVYRATTGAI